MNHDEFQTSLRRLHDQLSDTEAVSHEERKLLVALMGDIREVLTEDGAPPPEEPSASHGSLRDRLQASVVELEESHPVLVGHMRGLVNYLSDMGI